MRRAAGLVLVQLRYEQTVTCAVAWRDRISGMTNTLTATLRTNQGTIVVQLFPDQAAYEREEQRRFEILDAHWDLPVRMLDLDK